MAWYNISDDLYGYWVATFQGGFLAKQTRQLETFGRLTAQVLSNMPKLSTLSLNMIPIDVATFREAMDGSSPVLPTVTTLKITPHLEFLIPICPNVGTIDLQHGFQEEGMCTLDAEDRHHERRLVAWLATPTTKATSLQNFSLRTNWSRELLQAVLDAMSSLRSLNMYGTWYLDTLADLLPVVSKARWLHPACHGCYFWLCQPSG